MLSRWMSRLRGWRGDRRGMAAVEFALILLRSSCLYAGAGELSQAAMTNRKIELLSRTLVDLASQQPTSTQTSSTPAPANAITQATLQLFINASTAIMAPGPLASLTMTVSAVDIGNTSAGVCCKPLVRWTYTQSGTLRPCSTQLTSAPATQTPSPSTISSAVLPQGTALPSPVAMLIADVTYTYQAPFATQYIAFPVMHRTSYMFPRTIGQVILKGPITPTGNQSGTVCY